MANATEQAAIPTPDQTRPARVSIWGRDSSDGTLRPISVGTDGQLQLNLTGEGLALDVSVDGLETLATATNALLTNNSFASVVSLTRTNDTNIYAANDVIGAATGSTAALTFASMGTSGKQVIITSVALEIDAAAVISGETSYRLYLYNVTPPSATGDNGAWDLPSGDRASFLGYIDLGTPVDLGSTLYVEVNGVNKQVTLAGTSLFGYLVTIGTYTPTASRVYVVTLHAVGV